MSEIRVENIIGETGTDAVKFTKGINVTGIVTATNVSIGSSVTATNFFGSGAGLSGVSAGKILQVVQTVKTDTFSYNATAFTDITGLSAAITPSSSSNKVLVDCRLYLSAGTGGGTSAAKLNFVRGSTNIGQPSGSTSHMATFYSWGSNNYMEAHSMNFLDSPATTSATTYKIQIGADGTAATLYVNRYYSSNNYHGISTLTLMEVAA